MAILNVYYPYGQHEEVKSINFEKLGFYRLIIDQSNLKEKNLPNLFAKKTGLENIWDYEDKIDMWITTHELNTLIKYDVKYEFIEGIEWSHKIRGIDLFPWIPAFMKLKNQQDTYSSTKDP